MLEKKIIPSTYFNTPLHTWLHNPIVQAPVAFSSVRGAGRKRRKEKEINKLTSVPHARDPCVSHLFLELEDPIHQSFRCGWTLIKELVSFNSIWMENFGGYKHPGT